jgi:pimeloyl-ACP methyl ester carboxylesterase
MTELTYRAVPEETLYIDLPNTDGLKIKCILRGSLESPLVVMMHGLGGKPNSLIQYLGARYLHENGFSTLRLAMYDTLPQTRNLIDCTLMTHITDFETVVSYLRDKGVDCIFAEGHSYGGATILGSQAMLEGAVLWDPTHGNYWAEKRYEKYAAQFPEKLVGDIYIGLSGAGYLIPKAIEDYDRGVGDTAQWATGKGYPLKIIAAGSGAMADLGQKYIDVADEPKQCIVIEGAGHNFDDSDEVMMQLLSETESWFKEALNGRK